MTEAKILVVEDKAFGHMEHLEKLYLYNNALSQIHSNTFSGLQKLLVIDLNNNPISVIASDAFDHLNSLTTLILYGTQLIVINRVWFNQVPRPLRLAINNPKFESDAPFDCGQLCWLKEEEDAGTVG